jgi:NADH-quinone oxidoreductase subunit M
MQLQKAETIFNKLLNLKTVVKYFPNKRELLEGGGLGECFLITDLLVWGGVFMICIAVYLSAIRVMLYIIAITILLLTISFKNKNIYWYISLISANILFLYSVILYFFHFVEMNARYEGTGIQRISQDFLKSPLSENIYHLSLNAVSLSLVILTYAVLILAVAGSTVSITYRIQDFCLIMFGMIVVLIHVFCSNNLLIFYIAFEGVLIPIYLLIIVWGTRAQKYYSAFKFFGYTLFTSLFMLIAILLLYYGYNTLEYDELVELREGDSGLAGMVSSGCFMDPKVFDLIIWVGFFLSFATKLPLIPLHTWLPQAHGEAPTAGSIVLAGVLLKMGVFGFFKYLLGLVPEVTLVMQPLVMIISGVGLLYVFGATLRQTDLKKIIAYSSVVHMGYVFLGIMSCNYYGVCGGVYMMYAHGIVSSALFFIIGCLYERTHSRNIIYCGGLVIGMPIFSLFFFILTLANVSLPGTISFIGEFSILLGVSMTSIVVLLILSIGIILNAVYAFLCLNRVVFGQQKVKYQQNLADLNLRETLLLAICIFLIIFFGVFPNIILDFVEDAITDVVEEVAKINK